MIFSFYKIYPISRNQFFLLIKFGKFDIHDIFQLSEDSQCWLNLRNIGIWRHAQYTSDQLLIIWLYLCCKLSIISILYIIHSVRDNLPQVYIEPIGFTVESISKDIILRHCCGLDFCVKCSAKWAVKESKIWLFISFRGTSWKCCSIVFKEWFVYF